MTLRHLQVFLAVCDAGSVTLAAENMHISQPSVSLTIKELRNFYGVELFERVSKKLVLTSEGRIVYDYALRIISQFNDMNTSLERMRSGGSLYVGTGIAVGKLDMPAIAYNFSQRYPTIALHVNISSSDNIERRLADNILDVAILENTINANNLVEIPMQSRPLVAIARYDHPLVEKNNISLSDLAKEKLLLQEKYSHTRNIIDNAFAKQNLSIDPIWESASVHALINATGMGIGISILSDIYVKEFYNPDIRILDIDLQLSRGINLVYSKSRNPSPSAMKFIDYCKLSYQAANATADLKHRKLPFFP